MTGLSASGLQLTELETAHGPVKRFWRAEDVPPAAKAPPVQGTLALGHVPSWLRTPAPPEAPADTLLRPSDPAESGSGHTIIAHEARHARERALKRGTLIHRLLQSLPDVAPPRRNDAARDFLQRNAQALFTSAERDAMAAQVLALIDTPDVAALFAEGSRAEVSIAGRVARRGKPPALVSGQIDRLVVTPHEVLIADYKTNHAPPRTAADAPSAYVHQLALYRHLLQRLYPGRPVRCLLLWTETAAMMEIPASALDAELQSIIS